MPFSSQLMIKAIISVVQWIKTSGIPQPVSNCVKGVRKSVQNQEGKQMEETEEGGVEVTHWFVLPSSCSRERESCSQAVAGTDWLLSSSCETEREEGGGASQHRVSVMAGTGWSVIKQDRGREWTWERRKPQHGEVAAWHVKGISPTVSLISN